MNARLFLALAALLSLLVLLGCQADNGGTTVDISPGNPAVTVGQSVQFTANVSGTSNHAVLWRVVSTGLALGATISDTGLFVATTSGRYTVSAVSEADQTKVATTIVTVAPQTAITLSPSTATLSIGDSMSFTVAVTGTTDTRFTSATDGGTLVAIDATTVKYTAPATTGTYHVMVTSKADPTLSAAAVITVKPLVQFGTGLLTTLSIGDTLHVTAQTIGAANSAVTWSMQEADQAADLHTPSANAVDFVAPLQAGTYHLIATSVADTSVSATWTITVQAGGASGTIQ